MPTRKIKLVLEYDGQDLCGWQRQKNGPTVQQHLEEALRKLLRDDGVRVLGASRTDAGVHAKGQVAHLVVDSQIPTEGIRRAVNSGLPRSIVILRAQEVEPAFHARFSATGKHYSYRLLTREPRSPLLAHRAWHLPQPLDLPAMQRAAPGFIGEHDFSALRATGCAARTPVRRISAVDVIELPDDIVTIEVLGNAFLRNMVRILVGTLVAVGRGRIQPRDVPDIIASRTRSRAGQTAPPQGLTLCEVFYEKCKGLPEHD